MARRRSISGSRARQRMPGAAGVAGFVVCLGLVSGVASGAALPPLPTMACPLVQAEQSPQVDGVLEEAVWSQADVQQQFHRHYGGLQRPQEFRLLSDGEWLYVGVTADEKEILEKDAEIVEVFIAPHKASDQFVTFSVTLTAQGISKSVPEFAQGGAGDWRAAFRRLADRWELEVAFRADPIFGQLLSRGQVFDFNLSRTRAQAVGDSVDIYQQWSNTGTSSGSRYRFGEVTVGAPADRVPVIRESLRREMGAASQAAQGLSAAAREAVARVAQDGEALLAAAPGEGTLTTAMVQEYEGRASALGRSLRRAVLAERGALVWSCNPLAVPRPDELPPVAQEEAARLEIRVLGGEWESAALVVTNLGSATLDGQAILTDFVSADGKTRVPGWEVLQVRTAPLYLLHTGTAKRDPLPRLQEGDLFRVAPGENEVLWLTFRSRGLGPGRYRATLTIRSLDDRLRRAVEVVLRVYPLALGAAGRPWVNAWNNMLRGKDWGERAAHCRDYYLNVGLVQNWDELPVFAADAQGGLVDEAQALDFSRYDRVLDGVLQSGVEIYLAVVESHTYRFWPMRPQGWTFAGGSGGATFGIERWSPRFNAIFAKWVIAYRDHMTAKGLPPERWAFYIMDEPAAGEERQDIIDFARQVEAAAPEVQTYVTLPIRGGVDDAQNLEVSRYVDIIQGSGQAKPEVMAALRANAGGLWSYAIGLRGTSPFAYRRDFCWEPLRRGDLGVGFWCWDGNSERSFLWRDDDKGDLFAVLYNHHDNTIVPSLRGEAFREGIEDWKYVLMLDDAIAAARTKDVAPGVVSAAVAFRARCLDELTDADSAYRFRDSARSHLLALHTALGDVDAEIVKAVEAD